MPSVIELAAKMNREAAAALVKESSAMPADKVTWKPLDNGRTVLDQIQECAVINQFGAKMLETRAMPPFDHAAFEQMEAENDTLEKALTALNSGTDALVAAIEAFPPEHLDDTLVLPFLGGMTKSFAEVMLMNYWNMVYHQGQISYIQTLYGDREMHLS